MLCAEPSSRSVIQNVSCSPCESGAAVAGEGPDAVTPRSRVASSSRSLSGGRVPVPSDILGSVGLGTGGAWTRGAGVGFGVGGTFGVAVGSGSDVWGVGVGGVAVGRSSDVWGVGVVGAAVGDWFVGVGTYSSWGAVSDPQA